MRERVEPTALQRERYRDFRARRDLREPTERLWSKDGAGFVEAWL
jgi:hypothetical protein